MPRSSVPRSGNADAARARQDAATASVAAGMTSAMASGDPEVLRELRVLYIRSGSPPDLRQRDRALTWPLERPKRTLPVALARAREAPHDAVLIDLLGRLRSTEATASLSLAFADPRVRAQAAAGPGMSPDPAARAALMEALGSSDREQVVAALGGLGASADPAECATVLAYLHDADPETRWMALSAATRLGCLERNALEQIAREDPDPTVRALAEERLR